MRVGFITTLDTNLAYFYRALFEELRARGHTVTGVSSPGPEHERLRERQVETISVEIPRTPSPLKDLRALAALVRLLRRRPFELWVVSTPKAALLGAIAGLVTGQRAKTVYVVRGRAYENAQGASRFFYALVERLTCALSARVLVISQGLAEALTSERLCAPHKIETFARGSSKGVDLRQFSPVDAAERRRLRLAFAMDFGFWVGYVGWIRRDKGVGELLRAVERLNLDGHPVRLLLVGRYEAERDPLDVEDEARLQLPYVRTLDWMDDPSAAFAALDVFVFPSYREGFGNVALEAAASGTPVIASDIPGLREAVDFGETALPVRPQNVADVYRAILTLKEESNLRRRLGSAGRQRAEAHFSSHAVTSALADGLVGRRTIE